LSGLLLAAIAQSSAQLSDGFPLEQGTYWIYECATTRKGFNLPPVQKSFSWKAEILETMRQRDLVVALLRGHLDDLPGASEPKRGDYLIVAVRNSAFYLVPPSTSQDLFHHLKQNRSGWAVLIRGQGRLFLELPLVPGKGFPIEQAAKEESGPHQPGFDSWLVNDKRRLTLDSFKTDVPLGSVEQYSLTYALNKSEKQIAFVPGVGITEYDYHGYAGVPPTHAEWEGICKLVQYQLSLKHPQEIGRSYYRWTAGGRRPDSLIGINYWRHPIAFDL
jgi:hypothetical protein